METLCELWNDTRNMEILDTGAQCTGTHTNTLHTSHAYRCVAVCSVYVAPRAGQGYTLHSTHHNIYACIDNCHNSQHAVASPSECALINLKIWIDAKLSPKTLISSRHVAMCFVLYYNNSSCARVCVCMCFHSYSHPLWPRCVQNPYNFHFAIRILCTEIRPKISKACWNSRRAYLPYSYKHGGARIDNFMYLFMCSSNCSTRVHLIKQKTPGIRETQSPAHWYWREG